MFTSPHQVSIDSESILQFNINHFLRSWQYLMARFGNISYISSMRNGFGQIIPRSKDVSRQFSAISCQETGDARRQPVNQNCWKDSLLVRIGANGSYSFS
jgi:hypothetical protein